MAHQSNIPVEQHPLAPFLPEGARILLLGSFPPKRERWSMEFFYPNFNNDMWRIMGLLFYGKRDHFVAVGEKRFDRERVEAFCRERGIAIFDTATLVRRLKDNASDAFLEVVEPTDIAALLRRLPTAEPLSPQGRRLPKHSPRRRGAHCQSRAKSGLSKSTAGRCASTVCPPRREPIRFRLPSKPMPTASCSRQRACCNGVACIALGDAAEQIAQICPYFHKKIEKNTREKRTFVPSEISNRKS